MGLRAHLGACVCARLLCPCQPHVGSRLLCVVCSFCLSPTCSPAKLSVQCPLPGLCSPVGWPPRLTLMCDGIPTSCPPPACPNAVHVPPCSTASSQDLGGVALPWGLSRSPLSHLNGWRDTDLPVGFLGGGRHENPLGQTQGPFHGPHCSPSSPLE